MNILKKNMGFMKMKAIQTKYNGYHFRSRLEARWAVYFDSLGVEWEYEKEGYHFEDGTNYLCDFWFPGLGMWGEVKGKELNDEEIKKAENLVKYSHKPILLLIGVPERKPYYAIEPTFDVCGKIMKDDCGERGYYCNGEFIEYPGTELVVEFEHRNYALSNYHNYPEKEGRFYCNFEEDEINEPHFDDINIHVNKSKSARFEFEGN